MYKMTDTSAIIRVEDNSVIPADHANADYAAYLEWLNAGNKPEPADEPTLDEIRARALADIRKQRAPILSTLDGIAGRMFRAGDTATAGAADAAINALLDITKLQALQQAATYDDMKAAVLARYRQIAAASPVVVQTAFLEAVAP